MVVAGFVIFSVNFEKNVNFDHILFYYIILRFCYFTLLRRAMT